MVEIHAAGVNFPDVPLIANRYQAPARPPFIPGNEFAGRVIQLGPDRHYPGNHPGTVTRT